MALPKNQIRSFGTIEQHEHEDKADARRVLPVDEDGNPINDLNRFPVDVVISGTTIPDVPKIARVQSTLANTEYSYTFPVNTTRFKIRAEDFTKIQFSFEVGKSGIDYWTVMPGNIYEDSDLQLSGKTIYFQTSQASIWLQIFSWSY